MEKEQLLTFFEDHYKQIKEMVFSVSIWGDEPEKHVCKSIAEGLHELAKSGSKNAAAMYAAIAAYDNHAGTFSDETAMNLVFTMDAVSEYHQIIDEEFHDIVDAKYYDYLYAFPAMQFMNAARNIDKPEST